MGSLAPQIWARGEAGGEEEEPKGQCQSWKGLSLSPAGLCSTVVKSLCSDFPRPPSGVGPFGSHRYPRRGMLAKESLAKLITVDLWLHEGQWEHQLI